MTDTLKYTIQNNQQFFEDLQQFVDTKLNFNVLLANPGRITSEYFGVITSDKFTIYKTSKSMWIRSINLKINGSLNGNQLTMKINHYRKFGLIINHLLLIVFSIILLFAVSTEIGLGLLIITLIQLTINIWIYNKRRNGFIDRIEELVKENGIELN